MNPPSRDDCLALTALEGMPLTCKRLRDSPSPRRPALLSSASVNGKASKGQCGMGKNDMTHCEDP